MPDVLRWIEGLEAKTVARGCTPEEAQAAQTKAQELRRKYHLPKTTTRQRRRRTIYQNNTDRWQYTGSNNTWVPPYSSVVIDDPIRDMFTPERPWWQR